MMKINNFTTNYTTTAFGRNNSQNGLHTGGRQPVSIYAISQNGECKKYDSISDMAQDIGKLRQSASTALRRGQKFYGFILKKSSDIEDEQGNISAEKLQKALLTPPVRYTRPKKAVYAINPNGEISRYDSIDSMAKETGAIASKISESLKTGYRIHGLTVRSARDFEDESGKVDTERLNRLANAIKAKNNQEPITIAPYKESKDKEDQAIYAINRRTGQIVKFPSIKTASGVFGLTPNSIEHFLKNVNLKRGNFSLVRASNLETKDGELDKNKLKSYLA